MTDSTLTKTVFFDAPRQAVWSFLTDKDKLGIWFHPAEADLEAGKPFKLMAKDSADGSAICWGEVLEADIPSKMVMTFTIKPLNGLMTRVTWNLEESCGGTRLTLKHEGLDRTGEIPLGLVMALDKGWDEHLGNLRSACPAAA